MSTRAATVTNHARDLARKANIAVQRRTWGRRVNSWDHADSPGLDRVVEAVLDRVPQGRLGTVVDIGAGTGRLTLPLAERSERMIAVDVSAAMLDRLSERAAGSGLSTVETSATPAEQLDFEAGSVDLVVSNYALHHLRDADKAALVKAAAQWLKPGGLIVIGDMMFGRGGSPRDREIIAGKALAMLRKGPAGWWRIAKNAGRFLFRVQERPVSPETWVSMLRSAGLTDVVSTPVVAEAAVVSGRRPEGA